MTRFNRFYFSLVAVTLIGGANIVLGQMNVKKKTLVGPSGVIMSEGYPNSISVHSEWGITVEDGYRIQLQFFDFQLNETDSCYLDFVSLYDAPVQDDVNSLIGQWCWNNFTKLMPITFTSTSNSFYLIFRGSGGFTRKGFKAMYFSFNSSLLTTTETTSQVSSTTVGAINPGTHPDNDSALPTTTENTTHVPGTTVTTINPGPHTDSSLLTTTESTSHVPSTTVGTVNPGTQPADSSVLNTAEQTSHEPMTSTLGIASAQLTQVIIIAGGGAVIPLVCIVVVCIICLFCNRRSKRKNKEPVFIPSYDTDNQVTGGNTLNQSQDSNIIQNIDESGGGVYNVPSNEKGSAIASDNYDDIRYSRHIDVCIDSPQKQNGGDLRNEKLLDNNMQMSNLKGSPYDKKQSNSTKKTGSDEVDDIQAYSSVDVTNLTQPENVEARYNKDDVTYSLPVKNKRESEEMFYNVTYESYDS
ncbi:uncharacterized protein [Apostichopus japonicus]|uniref:uncharacterized protein isoform X2 n=1 Tax=Stichopus japonicus TaxID=307972 RepID=UPI003AB296A5